MQLSLRLSAIADMVTEGNRLVDVGCDHGYLPVYLIQEKKIPSAIAMDVRKGPLSRAEEHIRQYGLEEYIEPRLSDGLESLKTGEGDTLVIAGMGGPLMERILTDGKSVRDSFSELILQPQSDIPHFRRFIQSQGWEIVEEKMTLRGRLTGENAAGAEASANTEPGLGKIEQVGSGLSEEPYTLAEAFGKYLIQEKNPVLYRYLQREAHIRAQILEQLEAAPKADAVNARILEVKEEAQLIAAALAEYEG